MVFLPIAERELRVAARQGRTYGLRLRGALVGAVFGALLLLSAPARAGLPATAVPVFSLLGTLALLFCMFAGALATADSLTRERREGTLGFLFLTDLRGFDIVLGKLLAHGLRLGCALVAAVPGLAIPLLGGGIRGADFGQLVLLLLNTLFFFAALGLLISVCARDQRRAQQGAMLAVVVFWLILPAMVQAAPLLRCPAALTLLLQAGAPTSGLTSVPGPRYGVARPGVALLLNHLLGWGLLGLAAWRLPRAWQDRPAAGRARPWRARWERWRQGGPARRARLRAVLLEQNAVAWLVVRRRGRVFWPWVSIGLATLLFAPVAAGGAGDPTGTLLVATALLAVLHLRLKFGVAAEASNAVVATWQGGGLEVLLATPLAVAEVLRGHAQALRRQFRGPILAVGLLTLLAYGLACREPPGAVFGRRGVWATLYLGAAAMLPADALALACVGTWTALRGKDAARATSTTVARIVFLPWLLLLLLHVLLIAATAWRRGGPSVVGLPELLATWLALGLTNSALQTLWCQRQLRSNFRLYAASPASAEAPPGPVWTRLGRAFGRLRSRFNSASSGLS